MRSTGLEMRLVTLPLLLFSIGLSGYRDSYRRIFFGWSWIASSERVLAPGVLAKLVLSTDLLPFVNCPEYAQFPQANAFPQKAFQQIHSLFGDFSSSRVILSTWLNRFHPDNTYAQEVLDVFKRQISVGVQCLKTYDISPSTLSNYLGQFTFRIRPIEASKYHGIFSASPEVFFFHHGLRMLDPRIRLPLKKKSFLDIGAYNGDSALVLSEYAKDVYSIELSSDNFVLLNRVLAQNPSLSANVHAFHMGVSDKEGEGTFAGRGVGAMISDGPGARVEIITIDAFVQRYNLSVGFLKADVEGHGLAVVKGAAGTIARERPIFSLAAYHDFSEMYNMSIFLLELLPTYYFEWQMQAGCAASFFELSLFGRP
jgi:FkbM family methyltransferase